MGKISVQGRIFNIQGDAPTAEEAEIIKNALEGGRIEELEAGRNVSPQLPNVSVPDINAVPDVNVPTFADKILRIQAEKRATPASEQPPPPQPNILQRGISRLLGTDIQDPIPATRMGSILTGTLGAAHASGKLANVLAGAARTGGGPIGKAVAPLIKPVMQRVGAAAGAAGGAGVPEAIVQGFESAGIIDKGTRKKYLLSNEDVKEVMLGEALLSGYFDIAIGGVKHGWRTASRLFQGPTKSGSALTASAYSYPVLLQAIAGSIDCGPLYLDGFP